MNNLQTVKKSLAARLATGQEVITLTKIEKYVFFYSGIDMLPETFAKVLINRPLTRGEVCKLIEACNNL